MHIVEAKGIMSGGKSHLRKQQGIWGKRSGNGYDYSIRH